MEKSCFNCKYYDQPSFEMKEFCWECLRQEEVYARWERKPITNADHIRAMSDEELADMFVDIGECDRRCPAKLGDCIFSDSSCRSAWLEWLREDHET